MTDYKLVPVKRCAACGNEKPVSEMKTCMHNQMHRYVCDSKCMNDFYNPPKNPRSDAVAPAVQGEPVAWLYEDELPDNYPYEAMFPYSKVDGVRMFPVYAPQPAPDVAGLVEALDITELRKLLLILRGNIGGAMWTLDDEEEELAVRTEKAIDAIDAIAAHRKGGDQT